MADKKKKEEGRKEGREKRLEKSDGNQRWDAYISRRTYLDQIAGSRPRPLAFVCPTHVSRIHAHNR